MCCISAASLINSQPSLVQAHHLSRLLYPLCCLHCLLAHNLIRLVSRLLKRHCPHWLHPVQMFPWNRETWASKHLTVFSGNSLCRRSDLFPISIVAKLGSVWYVSSLPLSANTPDCQMLCDDRHRRQAMHTLPPGIQIKGWEIFIYTRKLKCDELLANSDHCHLTSCFSLGMRSADFRLFRRRCSVVYCMFLQNFR